MTIDLDSIRVLYRQPDCLALWGIPYDMRPGQSPRDLWNAPRPDVLARVGGKLGAMLHAPGPLDDWVFLGCPGWWCNISREDQQQIQIWLDKLGDLVPGNPCEWVTLPRVDTTTETRYDRDMGSRPEQYDIRGTKSSWRRWKRYLKRWTSRLRRRLGKRLLDDDAPIRVTKGWVD